MGLGTVIDITATRMNSEQFIIRNIKENCDGERAGMSSDHITTTLSPSSLHLDNNTPEPEPKDAIPSEHSNLRHLMELSEEVPEVVPSDPFVSSIHHHLDGSSSSTKVHTTNGRDISLAGNQPLLGERCFDSGNSCPHDPEPSTSQEGLKSKEVVNSSSEQKEQQTTSGTVNGKCDLRMSSHNGSSSQTAGNDSHDTEDFDKDVSTPLSISLNSGNSNELTSSSSDPKQDLFPAADDIQQGGSRRSLIGTAPLSPNHYGAILAPSSPSFRVKRPQIPPSQSIISIPTRGRIGWKFPTDIRESSKKQKMQEERQAPLHSASMQSLQSMGTSEDRLRIPSEQMLNKALDLLRKPAAQDDPSEVKAPKRSYPKKSIAGLASDIRDAPNRKILQEKIGKLRDRNGLALSVPHLERAHLSQLVNLLQRFKNHIAFGDYLSKEVTDCVFGDGTVVGSGKPESDIRSLVTGKLEDRINRYLVDPDVTESEDSDEGSDEQIPSTSHAYSPARSITSQTYYDERLLLGLLDAKALCMEQDCEEKMSIIYRQLDNIRKKKKAEYPWNRETSDDCCARCLPFDGSRRRYLKRRKIGKIGENGVEEHEIPVLMDTVERLRAYAAVDSRVHPQLSLLSTLPVERRSDVYCRRRSTRPIIHLRKRLDRSPWTTFLEERKVAVKEAVIVDDRQTRKKQEKSEESEESYDDDEDYQPDEDYPHRASYSRRGTSLRRVGQKPVRGSQDRKRNGDFRSRRFTDHRLRMLRSSEYDEALTEPMPGLPQKIDYKEICIPHWERKPLTLVPEEGPGCMHLAECSSVAEISRRHLPYELNERKRFQQYRDYVAAQSAATASKLSGSSHSKHRATSTAPSATGSAESTSMLESIQSVSAAPSPVAPYFTFDDDQPSPHYGESAAVPDYDRPSMAPPYSPRTFPGPL